MRDARYIREHDPRALTAWLGRTLRALALVAALAAAFVAGRRFERARSLLRPAVVTSTQAAGPSASPLPAADDLSAGGALGLPAASAQDLQPERREATGPGLTAAEQAGAIRAVDGLQPVQRLPPRPGDFTLHLGTFVSKEEARAFASQVARRGYPPTLFGQDGQSQRTAVRFGRFGQESDAEFARARLGRSDVAATVVRQEADWTPRDRPRGPADRGRSRGH